MTGTLDAFLAAAIEDSPDARTRDAVKLILERMSVLDPVQHVQFTYQTFRNMARLSDGKSDASVLVNAVDTLDRVGAITIHFEFDVDDVCHEFSEEDLATARKDGGLVHPETGEVIHDFERLLVKTFSMSTTFADAVISPRTASMSSGPGTGQ